LLQSVEASAIAASLDSQMGAASDPPDSTVASPPPKGAEQTAGPVYLANTRVIRASACQRGLGSP
jgi:hypothetical protein